MTKKAYTGRRAARVLIVQGLYAWLVSEHNQSQLIEDLLKGAYNKMLTDFEPEHLSLPCKKVDEHYYRQVLDACIKNAHSLNEKIEPLLDRQINQLGPVEHALLLLGVYELCYRKDIPYKVVINEAIDLAKDFGAQASHKYINGVLDKIAQRQQKPQRMLQEA